MKQLQKAKLDDGVNVRLNEQLRQRLERLAELDDRKLSQSIRRALEAGVEAEEKRLGVKDGE